MVDVTDMLVDMVETGTPLNKIMKEFDYEMTSAQRSLLLRVLADCSKEVWYNRNGDLYRVLHLRHEVRFEYICGTPYVDIPWTGDADIGVNTADFVLDSSRKNHLKSYHERVGSLKYRFDWSKTTDLGDNLRVLNFYLDAGKEKRLALPRSDWHSGYVSCSPTGFELISGHNSELRFRHAVVGMWGRRVLLNYAYV